MLMNQKDKNKEPLFLDYNQPIEKRVDDLIGRLALDEKLAQLINDADGVERLNIPKYNWWNECLHGVGFAGIATVFPQAIALAATWDLELMSKVATAISDEARAKHHKSFKHMKSRWFRGLTFFSPNINIFRDPRWGRGQETYGEDPYLTSRMGVTFVKGLQGDHPKYLKIIATPKHYAVHSGPEPERHSINVVINKKDLWETYLPAFKACIQEGKAFSIMGAYNRTNGEACCASNTLLEEILRKKWDFKGYVVSDCGAIADIFRDHKLVETGGEAAAIAINAGCDLFCRTINIGKRGKKRWKWIKDAVEKGLLTEETIDISLKRLFMARFLLGMFDPPEIVPYAQIPYEVIDCEEHRNLALRAARESIVLLKNENDILPLDKNIKSISVIGPNADDLDVLLGNYSGASSKYTTPLQGIKNKVSSKTKVFYSQGCPLKKNSTDGFNEAVEIAKKSEVIIMVLGISPQIESEEGMGKESDAKGDRIDLNLPKIQEELLKKIYATGKPIILTLTSGSALSINFAKENIPAILEIWYPGEEGGTALADVIFGDYNPAGKLPVTFYKSVEHLPDFRDYNMEGRTYRYFKGEPLFSFGYGLSYTKFRYSNLQINPNKVKWGDEITMTIDVENIGNWSGDEVVQLYLSKKSPSMKLPIRELQGFNRITLEKGEKKTVSFALGQANYSHFDENGMQIVEPGEISISIGGCQPGFSEDDENIVSGSFEIIGEIK